MTDSVKTGIVFIPDFDRGVITTMGAVTNAHDVLSEAGVVINKAGGVYVIKNMNGVSPPPGYEGVPVYFAFPDETVDLKIMPSIVVRRDSITPAMSRWHLGSFDYSVPAPGARPVTVTNPITGDVIATGWDRYEKKDQGVPFDFLYTIECRARFRNNLKVESMQMLRYMMGRYQPYTTLFVADSLGDTRTYDAFMETPTAVDIMPDVSGKEANFNMTLRVEGELDINDPYVVKVLSGRPTINLSNK